MLQFNSYRIAPMPRSIDSTASDASRMSVLFEGKEIELETALDKGITDLQKFLNNLQCYLRELAQMDDLDEDECEDFKEMIKKTDLADDAIDDMGYIMSELKGVTRQILGPCPKDIKTWYKEHKEARKAAADKEKEDRKAAAARAKEFNAEKAKLDAVPE